ncbi:MAG TPA: glycosyltransferase family 87 protein, partial [Puia sp.]|nr:glycosyltransferase family 87 protein [Puia sp.]
MFWFKKPTESWFRYIFILYIVIAITATIQCYYGFMKPYGEGGRVYPNYNNFLIFRNSFFHLIQGKDLYGYYPNEQWDLYKYSPTFSVFFGLLAWLPDFAGLLLWNLLNTIPLFIGIKLLKAISDRGKIFAMLFCLVELTDSLQTAQSNGLTAALLILTFTSLESKRYFHAAFLVVFSIYLKIYGGIGLLLFIFYPAKAESFSYTLFWILILGLLPLVFIDLNQLFHLYKDWNLLLKTDQENSIGISVMSILYSGLKLNISKKVIMLAGILLLLVPLFQVSKYKMYGFRLLVLSSILVSMVIFNYKAESSTYIIAICGIAIWYFSQPATRFNLIILILSFIFTTLATGDLFPHFLKDFFDKIPYLKAIFPTLIYGIILFDLFHRNFGLEKSGSAI